MGRGTDPLTESGLSQTQREASDQAWSAGATLLESGAQGAASVLLAELTRAVHSCRVAGLPRLSGAGLRVTQQLRELHAHRPEFRLASLTRDVQEMLATAHTLRSSASPGLEWIGVARRTYSEVGTLDLVGLFTEPVVSAAGYAGVVTYLVDRSGAVWSLADVAPGTADRCRWSYVTPIEFGGVSIEHRALCRGGLHLDRATAAANRRLGSGQRVLAELTEGVPWSATPLSSLWDIPLEVQLDRAWETRTDPRAGDDLVFLRCTVGGNRDDALELHVGPRLLRGIAPSAHKQLGYRRNLRALTAVRGRPLMIVGRVAFSQPGTISLLAAEVVGDDGTFNLALDALPSARIRVGAPIEGPAHAPTIDPLEPLTRRLRQVLLGGRPTLTHAALKAFVDDEERLTQRQMPTAARLMRELRTARDASSLATAWLAARVYLVAASGRLQRVEWLAKGT